MKFIIVHNRNGEPFFINAANIVCFGDKWITLAHTTGDTAVKESIKEIAQMLDLVKDEDVKF